MTGAGGEFCAGADLTAVGERRAPMVDMTDVVETQKARFSETALLSASFYNGTTKARAYYMAPVKQASAPFHIWGDLQEKKEQCNSTEEVLSVKPNARAFECLIKEYGVPVRNPRSLSHGVVVYDRLFRLFGTNI